MTMIDYAPRRRAATATLMLLVALLVIGGGMRSALVALADGDPASDVLIGGDVFYPYSPAVAKDLEQRLGAETAAARAAGFTVKVALVASASDLGAVTVLFGKPETYAHFLEAEIRELAPHQLLLVVMPSGYGVSSQSRAAQEAVARLSKPAGDTSDDLARAAIVAVPNLAAAAGHPLKDFRGQPAVAAKTSATSWTPPTAAILALGAIVIAGAIIIVRQRRARRRAPHDR